MRRHIRRSALLVALGLTAAACSGATAPTTDGEDAAPDTAAAEPSSDPTTVVLAISREPDSMSPLFLDVQAGNWPAFEGLYAFDADLGLEPVLATDQPDVSDDGLTWTIALRDDARFHDGEPFSADDVVATWQAVTDPSLASPLFDRWTLDGLLDEVVAEDDHTVRFELARLDPAFHEKLTMGIVPAHRLAEEDPAGTAMNREPIGTGPYRWVETRPGERMVYEAVEGHHRVTPNIDRVVYVFLGDENARVTALRDGSIDAATVPPRLAATFADDPAFQVIEIPSGSIEQLTLPNGNPALADAEVRRAIAMGIDRQAMLDTIAGGVGAVANTPIVPGHWAHDPDVTIEHDPDAAAALLDEAGWAAGEDGMRSRDGVPLGFTIMYLPNQIVHQELALAIRSDLAALGIDVEVEGVDSPEYEQRIDTDGWLHGVGTPYDPDTELWSRFHSSFAADGNTSTNRAAMTNPEVDAALEASRATVDRDERAAAYADLQRALVEDGSYLHLLQRGLTVVAVADLEGLQPQLMGSPHAFPRGLIWNLPEWSLSNAG